MDGAKKKSLEFGTEGFSFAFYFPKVWSCRWDGMHGTALGCIFLSEIFS